MKIGKIPEEWLRRSVLEQIGHRRAEVLAGPAIGADCAALQTDPDTILLFSGDPITGTATGIGKHGIQITANDLAAAGSEPVAVLLTALLPETVAEADLHAMLHDAETACQELNIEIIGGHTEITDAVTRPVLSVVGVGRCKRDELLRPEAIRPGQDLVVSKWIGLEASVILAADRTAALQGTLSQDALKEVQSWSEKLSVVPEAMLAKKSGVCWMHDITEGGILGALWEVAEAGRVGLSVQQEWIPLRKETQALCARFDADPYRIMSGGSLLMVSADGEALVRSLSNAKIPAALIGHTVPGLERTLHSPTGDVPITAPGPDALYRALQRSQEKDFPA